MSLTSRLILLLVTSALCAVTHAQGGPPFRTDDPDTVANKHLEVNLGFIADRNLTSGSYQVPDIDLNYGLGDRLQLKYEVPLALQETRPQAATTFDPATPGQVIGGLGESLLGIKWRFYERHAGDPALRGRLGTGLLGLMRHTDAAKPASASGDSPGADSEGPPTTFSIGTYPQLYLDNPSRSVPRGIVAPGPNFYLPLEINGRIGWLRYNADFGYNFGSRNVPQSWNRGLILGREFTNRTEAYVEIYDLQDANTLPAGRGTGNFATGHTKQRETTLGIGGRQAINHDRTLNLLLMGGRSFQTIATTNSQPSWIAYVGLQVTLGPK